MNKKSKLLKNWPQTAAYLTAIAALVSFAEPLSAGFVRDADDGNIPPRRVVQVVLGLTNDNVDPHPNGNAHFGHSVALTDENTVRTYMRDILPAIDKETHIQFWLSKHTTAEHTLRALSGAAGAQANAYKYAVQNLGLLNVANVTFSLHQKE